MTAEGGGALCVPRAFLGTHRSELPKINTTVRVVGRQSWGQGGDASQKGTQGVSSDLKGFIHYTWRQCKGLVCGFPNRLKQTPSAVRGNRSEVHFAAREPTRWDGEPFHAS